MKIQEEIQAHKLSIATAWAKDPKSVNYARFGTATSLGYLHDKPFDYSLVTQPIAPGHNPDKLTTEQVGEGWRLLDEDETKDRTNDLPYISCWSATEKQWIAGAWAGSLSQYTYRTKLSREQIALLDKNEGWIPWLAEGKPTIKHGDSFEVTFRDGRTETETYPNYCWGKSGFRGDIIAYRIIKPSPKFIPWTRETCPPLPFEVRHKDDGKRYALVSAEDSVAYVICVGWRNYADVLNLFTLPNGTPCGQEVKQ